MTDPATSGEHHWLPSCRQLFDSGLPTGGYAHSFGLEGLVQDGEVSSMEQLEAFVHVEVAHSLIHVDLPLLREAHAAVVAGDLERIQSVDTLANALRPTLELRRAGAQCGRQTWRLYLSLLEDNIPLAADLRQLSAAFTFHQATVVNGVLSALLGIPVEAALAAYSHQCVGNFAQAAIKLLGSGPTRVQGFLLQAGALVPQWVDRSLNVSLDQAGSFSPRWDIASARHETAERRLYIS